jgi:molybdate transport system ATP-binding protein
MRISIQNVKVLLAGKEVLNDVSIEMNPNEHWAFIGESGSGKSMLAKAISKKIYFAGSIDLTKALEQYHHINVVLIEQQHRFKNKQNTNQFYYQQRFNSADSEETITVLQELNEISKNESAINTWSKIFSIDKHLEKSLLLLSNGENKRLQLTKAMLKNPDLLILDNPFVGLDNSGREELALALDMITEKGVKLIVIAQENDLPKCISHVAVLRDGRIIECRPPIRKKPIPQIKRNHLNYIDEFTSREPFPFNTAIKMVNVNVTYNNTHILKNINWQVNKGEKWVLNGANGSGKSTLLSLVNADNPQAYANEIYIFDRKKGSGESIWDIKKYIGFVSPELHLYFDKGINCFQTIASGLFDTIGLFRKINEKQQKLVENWLKMLDLEEFSAKTLQTLPLGRQRLVLLARALIKNPALLLLDEPCQGLDEHQTEQMLQIIDRICENPEITLVYTSHYTTEWPNCINKQLTLDSGEILNKIK